MWISTWNITFWVKYCIKTIGWVSTKEFFAELWAGSPGPMVCARCISVMGFITLSVMGKITVIGFAQCTYPGDSWLIYLTRNIICHGLYIFSPIFKEHFFVFKEVFFRKFSPYVWLVFKSGLWWRAYGNQSLNKIASSADIHIDIHIQWMINFVLTLKFRFRG